jgi:hypothetical protein
MPLFTKDGEHGGHRFKRQNWVLDLKFDGLKILAIDWNKFSKHFELGRFNLEPLKLCAFADELPNLTQVIPCALLIIIIDSRENIVEM